MQTKLVICTVLGLFLLSSWLLGHLYGELLMAYEQMSALQDLEYSWIFRLLLNLLGYSTVILPFYGLYKYLEKTNYFDKISNNGRLSRWLRALFCEHERLPDASRAGEGAGTGAGEGAGDARSRDGLEFAFCFTGLMGAYLVWGLLQEKIMTQDYVMSDGSVSRFTDSQFLVFINRLLGFLIALARLAATRRPVLGAPLYKFSYCALTNVVSAWCQYEALKFVSFPTQVLSKSCKVVPVMLMGKLISRCKYETYEYATAALISVGMALFLFGIRDEAAGGGSAGGVSAGSTGASGAALLALYLACDGFTSSWQGALFRRHSLRPLQMLCCVSLCSCGLTAAALARRPLPALLAHPAFLADAALLAASSAAGQLLIYRTIARFGPALFAMAMTARQACSVLLSCAVYGHRVPPPAAGGALLVLAAVLLRLHCRPGPGPPAAVARVTRSRIIN